MSNKNNIIIDESTYLKFDPLSDKISSVQAIDHMGSDLSVVNAARVSFDKVSAWERNELPAADAKLIQYLAKHNHWTPFGHVQISMRVKAPIFVARQLVKHQVGLVWNEVSRRYVSDSVELYMPEMLRMRPEGSIKQGSSEKSTMKWRDEMNFVLTALANTYYAMIEDGVAPEEARMILPLNMYTEWIWTGSLAAWMRIVNLRDDSHAQSQCQAYGKAFGKVVYSICPQSYYALRTQTAQ